MAELDREILFDVDGVILSNTTRQLVPGIQMLIDVLRLLGFKIAIWSSLGDHAQEAVDKLGLNGVARCFEKPDYPIQLDAALALLGNPPALQLDDDATERVGDWPFAWIQHDESAVERLQRERDALETLVKRAPTIMEYLLKSAVNSMDAGYQIDRFKENYAEIVSARD